MLILIIKYYIITQTWQKTNMKHLIKKEKKKEIVKMQHGNLSGLSESDVWTMLLLQFL